jgi:cytochrome c-type biogenesis protein CcmH/NrfG
LQANPHDARALAALGRIRESEGDAEQALANYQRALAANPRDAELARHVSDISQRMARSPSGETTNSTPPTRVVSNPPVTPR